MIDKKLMREMPNAKKQVIRQVLMQWISLLCNIGFVMMISGIIVEISKDTLQIQKVWYMAVLSILLLMIRMLCMKLASRFAYLASCDVKDQIRKRLYEKLLQMKNSYHDYISTSELVQLNVEGVDQLETYFGRYLPQFFYSLLAPVTLFLILMWFDIKSSLVLLLCVPLIPLSIVAVQNFAKKLLSKYWTSYATLGNSFLENLQGLMTLKIYQADEYKNIKMNEEAENFRKITMKVLTMQLNSVSVMDVIAYGGAAIGSIVAINGYLNGSVSLFAVICIILLSSQFFVPLRLLGSFFHIAMNGIAASAKIFRILDMPLLESDKQHFDEEMISINFDKLNFSYDKSRKILHDISLSIKPKQFIGIVGKSGSGKSTLAKIITGFTGNYEGSLTMQGKERRNIDDSSFYERVVYVTHKPTILKGTIKENLCIAKPNASDEECWEVLKKTRLLEFVEEQGGLGMCLLENGSNLSGGQRQRLSLARALLANREIYIFDEATSNIDVDSEDAILQIILQLAKTKTVIMITHRLHNVLKSDQIFVMENGCCVEHGNHEALMKQKQVYYTMYTKQMELEQLEGEVAYA